MTYFYHKYRRNINFDKMFFLFLQIVNIPRFLIISFKYILRF